MLTTEQLEMMKKYSGLVDVVPCKEWRYGLTLDQANEIANLFSQLIDDDVIEREIKRLKAEELKPSKAAINSAWFDLVLTVKRIRKLPKHERNNELIKNLESVIAWLEVQT